MSQASKGRWSQLEEPKKTEAPRIRKATKWSDLEEPKQSAPAPIAHSKWSQLECDVDRREAPKATKWSNLDSEIVSTAPRPQGTKWSELETEEPRFNNINNKGGKYASLEEPEVISRGPRQVRPHGPIMDRQDPRHMIAQAAPSITLRKSVLAASLENAIISQKHENKMPIAIPIVPSKPKTQNKKAQKVSADDLDEDEDERKAAISAAKARLAALVESEEEEEVEEEEGDRPLTKAEKKAAKQEAKKKRMIAAGLGHMYDHH